MLRLLLTIILSVCLFTACSDSNQGKAVTVVPQKKSPPLQQSSEKIFERVASVLDGYQAFSGKLPLKLQDLDSGEYMFDSAYLADILPQDVVLYLEFSADKGATRMWLQQAGQEPILSRTLADPHLEKLSAADLHALKARWQEIAKTGRLTQVKL